MATLLVQFMVLDSNSLNSLWHGFKVLESFLIETG